MATNKQVKMMLARASEAGMDVKWDDLTELDNGEVDEKLAEIKKFHEDGKAAGTKKDAETTPKINNIRLGLCMKLIIQESNVRYLCDNSDDFKVRVSGLYKLFTETEEAVSSSSGNN